MGIYGSYARELVLKGIRESSDLNDNQIRFILKTLDSDYIKKIETIAKKELNKFSALKKQSYDGFDYYNNFGFDRAENFFYCRLVSFENYAFNSDESEKEILKLFNDYISDVSSYAKSLRTALSDIKNMKVEIFDSNGEFYPLSDYKRVMLNRFKESKYFPDNHLAVYVIANKQLITSITPTDSYINEIKRKKYEDLYIKFAQFVKKPSKLNGSFGMNQVADICKIIGLSSADLNDKISKNITSMGTKYILDPNKMDDSDYGKNVSKRLGECYEIESFDAELILYSIENKKIYWVDLEHSECSEFYNNYPFESKELGDVVYDEDEKKSVKEIFKQIDAEKGFNLIEGEK